MTKSNLEKHHSWPYYPNWDRYILVLALVWTVIIIALVGWNLTQLNLYTQETTRIQARSAYEKDIIYRSWNASHGGVYVPVTEKTQPNPYLVDIEEREITTPSGRLLTLINPAYMTRQVHELGAEKLGIRSHITSLNPIRPANAADDWETNALQAFEHGETEISSIEELDGIIYMRLMRPLVTEESCLKCHAAQGYQIGDVRGGISVDIPMAPLRAIEHSQRISLLGGYGLLWLLGLLGLTFARQHIISDERVRRQAEEALLDNEEKYRALYENAPLSYQSLDEDGCFIDINPAWLRTLGYNRNEVIGKRYADFLHPDWKPHFEKNFPTFKKRGYVHDVQYKIRHKDERYLDISFEGCIGYNPDGSFRQTYCVFQDITERVLAEQKLRKNEEKFRTVIQAQRDLIYHYLPDEKGTITLVNDAYCHFFGKSSDEIVGTSHFDKIPEEEYETVRKHIASLTEKNPIGTNVTQNINSSGESRWFEWIDQALFNENGEISEYQAIGRDITERLQAEKALQESEMLKSAIIENFPMGISVRNKDGSLLTANKTWKDIWKIPKERYQEDTKSKEELSFNEHDNYLGEHLPKVKKVYESGGKYNIPEVRLLNSVEGKAEWISQFFYAIQNDAGGIENIVVLTEDITEQKKAEEEKLQIEAHLRQQQKLESIGTLASGVAHEINNPLTGIMNYAQLIHDRLDPAESRLREFSAGIIEETERVAEIVRNLLTFARQDKQSYSPARLADIVNNTLSLIRTIIKRDQITLEVELPDDLPEIKCRSQQIQQVLMNLLTNARDALNERYPEYDPDKIITVSVQPFEKGGRRWLRTTVEDHGGGIPAEIRERIFDPFFTTKDRALGTGLGLSISLGIVQDHHGELTFESEEGQPTRFHLDLPVDNGGEL